MEISEIIGMLISIAAILFLVISPLWEARKEKRNPEEYAEVRRKKEKRMKEFMKSLNIDNEEEEVEKKQEARNLSSKKQKGEKLGYVHEQQTVVSSPKLFKTPHRTTQGLHRTQQMDIYQTKNGLGRNSRGSNVIQGLKSKQDMIILHEIIGPPKALKEKWD